MRFSISVNDHETIAALAKAIEGEIVTHWAASTNPPVRVVHEPLADVVEIGALVIDTKAHDVTDDGVPVMLKPREYALLLALARGAGHAFTREKLLELAWPLDAAIKPTIVRWTSTFDAYVSNSETRRRASRRSIAWATV